MLRWKLATILFLALFAAGTAAACDETTTTAVTGSVTTQSAPSWHNVGLY